MTLGPPARAAQLFQRTAPGVLALLGRGHTLVDRTRRAGTDLAQLLTRRYAFASDVPPALVRFTDEMLSSTPMDVIADFFPTFAAHEKVAALVTLARVPVEIIVGDHDLLTPASHSERMAAAIERPPPAATPAWRSSRPAAMCCRWSTPTPSTARSGGSWPGWRARTHQAIRPNHGAVRAMTAQSGSCAHSGGSRYSWDFGVRRRLGRHPRL